MVAAAARVTKVRRTGWHGVGIDLAGPDDLVDEVMSHLPSFYDDAQPLRATISLFKRGDVYALEIDGARPSAFVETYPSSLDLANLVELTVVERLPDLVAIHAGAVAFDERVVLLPGSTQTGKTHLVTALLSAGATYLSDEFALIDDLGLVHPYPRMLALREDGGIRRAGADEFGELASHGPLSAAGLAVLTYDAGVRGLDADQANASEAWMHLVEHCICARRRPAEAFASTTFVAKASAAVAGRRGEAESVVQELRQRLGL